MPASILEEVDDLLEAAPTRKPAALHDRPARGSAPLARVSGDDGVIPSVCTARGHSWS
ncbi:hypothetical protein ACGFS9_21170 [Streptomyces sp. NPDC048566]|uniref:hypothetical protein n=1 Tax=Streptomyces sp. NPDC048566 TaxID=3365569 RepID=UPI0037244444